MATIEQTREEIQAFCVERGLPWTKISIGYRQVGGKLTDEIGVIVGVPVKHQQSAVPGAMRIPRSIDGNATDVQGVSYKIPPLLPWPKRPRELTSRHRPVHPGDSIGEKTITAGTTGAFVHVEGETDWFVLSNAHVLAATNKAPKAAWILQPGPHDGGGNSDVVAHLFRRVHINFPGDDQPPPGGDCLGLCWQEFLNGGGLGNLIGCVISCIFRGQAIMTSFSVDVDHATLGKMKLTPQPHSLALYRARDEDDDWVVRQDKNYVDAAIAKVTTPDLVSHDSHHLGPAKGVVELKLGDPVEKVGRTTEKSEGKITEVNATVRVDYGEGIATTEDQLVSDIRSAGGDSGSIVRHTDDRIGGLLFAGGGGQTIINRIQHVERLLGVRFV